MRDWSELKEKKTSAARKEGSHESKTVRQRERKKKKKAKRELA